MKNQTKFTPMLLAIAAIITLFSCTSCNNECKDLTTETLTITQTIQGVIIEGPWEVSISQDSLENSAFLEYSTSKKQKITAEVLPNGYLYLKVNSWGASNCRNAFRATVKATALEQIEGSGATIIRTYGHFSSLQKITLSGASKVNGLSCDGSTAKMKLSGASILESVTFTGYEIDADFSGASDATFDNVNLEFFKVDCSGASKLTCKGYATKTNFIGSGASTFKTLNLESENLDVDLSGASEGEVTVNNTIKGRLAGASMLKYKRATDVSGVHLSGSSRIVKLD
jgi:hypothetical protein